MNDTTRTEPEQEYTSVRHLSPGPGGTGWYIRKTGMDDRILAEFGPFELVEAQECLKKRRNRKEGAGNPDPATTNDPELLIEDGLIERIERASARYTRQSVKVRHRPTNRFNPRRLDGEYRVPALVHALNELMKAVTGHQKWKREREEQDAERRSGEQTRRLSRAGGPTP